MRFEIYVGALKNRTGQRRRPLEDLREYLNRVQRNFDEGGVPFYPTAPGAAEAAAY